MVVVKVEGEKKDHEVFLYTLSTCGWCRKTKDLLDKSGVKYDYVYVDLQNGENKEKAREEVKRWNPAVSFPTLVIDNERATVGFKKDQIEEVIGHG